MSKKNKIPLGVRQEFDDVDYWSKLPRNKFHTLEDGTKISEYDYMKKFMQEYYGNGFSRSEPESNILQTDDQKEEARRNNNNTNRDALNVINKLNQNLELFPIDEKLIEQVYEEFWEKDFKTSSYEETYDSLVKFTEEKLKIKFNDKVEVFKIYLRVKKLLKMIRKDSRIKLKVCKECNKRKSTTEFWKHKDSKDGFVHRCNKCRGVK